MLFALRDIISDCHLVFRMKPIYVSFLKLSQIYRL